MRKNIKYSILLSLLVLFVTTPVLVNAQSWYDNDLNKGRVESETTLNGRSANGREIQTANPSEVTTQSVNLQNQLSDDEKAKFRTNSFSTLSELRNLSPKVRQEKINEFKEAAKEKRCEMVRANIQTRTDYYQNSYTQHLNRYQGIKIRIENAIERLNVLGVDTTSLSTELAELEGEIQKLNEMHDALIATLVNAKVLACSEDKVAFQAELNEAKVALKEERAKVIEIFKSIKEEIVQIVQSLAETEAEDETDSSESEI